MSSVLALGGSQPAGLSVANGVKDSIKCNNCILYMHYHTRERLRCIVVDLNPMKKG